MRRTFAFLMGTLVGGLVGALAALLFAPKAGTELRGHINERGKAFIDEVRHAADVRRIELQERLETLRTPAQQ